MFRTTLIAIAAASCSGALAAVSAEEAKQLGTTLTPIGVEKAGNKDGTIPAYAGGLTAPPAGFKKGDGIRLDPFASEKPLYSIDGKNLDKYADKLTEGTKELLKRYPGFRVDVYPTHRSVAILEAAESEGCDLIFMASRGPKSIGGIMVSSQTIKVLAGARLVSSVARNAAHPARDAALATIRDKHRSSSWVCGFLPT